MIETLPSCLQARDEVEDHRALLGAHRRQRLVEQDDVRVGVDRARDRDRLALAAGQARHGDVDARDVDADLIERLARFALHLAVGQERQRTVHLLAAQEQVVVDRQFVDQREVLVDGLDAFRARVVDAFRLIRLRRAGTSCPASCF